ncbi:unnamed protein product [Gordionus sp. m RMFG-2023]
MLKSQSYYYKYIICMFCKKDIKLVGSQSLYHRKIACYSSGEDDYHICPINDTNPYSVEMERVMDNKPCYLGTTYGVIRWDYIWVSKGCKAEFMVKAYGFGGYHEDESAASLNGAEISQDKDRHLDYEITISSPSINRNYKYYSSMPANLEEIHHNDYYVKNNEFGNSGIRRGVWKKPDEWNSSFNNHNHNINDNNLAGTKHFENSLTEKNEKQAEDLWRTKNKIGMGKINDKTAKIMYYYMKKSFPDNKNYVNKFEGTFYDGRSSYPSWLPLKSSVPTFSVKPFKPTNIYNFNYRSIPLRSNKISSINNTFEINNPVPFTKNAVLSDSKNKNFKKDVYLSPRNGLNEFNIRLSNSLLYLKETKNENSNEDQDRDIINDPLYKFYNRMKDGNNNNNIKKTLKHNVKHYNSKFDDKFSIRDDKKIIENLYNKSSYHQKSKKRILPDDDSSFHQKLIKGSIFSGASKEAANDIRNKRTHLVYENERQRFYNSYNILYPYDKKNLEINSQKYKTIVTNNWLRSIKNAKPDNFESNNRSVYKNEETMKDNDNKDWLPIPFFPFVKSKYPNSITQPNNKAIKLGLTQNLNTFLYNQTNKGDEYFKLYEKGIPKPSKYQNYKHPFGIDKYKETAIHKNSQHRLYVPLNETNIVKTILNSQSSQDIERPKQTQKDTFYSKVILNLKCPEDEIERDTHYCKITDEVNKDYKKIGVLLIKSELEDSLPCVFKKSYGVTKDRKSVWVSSGCKAWFQILY